MVSLEYRLREQLEPAEHHPREVFAFNVSNEQGTPDRKPRRRLWNKLFMMDFRFDCKPGEGLVAKPHCNGLEVVRFDEPSIQAELGAGFRLREVRRHTHTTPWQSEQKFVYFRFQRRE